MFARVDAGGFEPAQRRELDAVVRERLIPALAREPGFIGALNLVDRASGDAMVIVLWETQDQAELPPRLRGSAFREALATMAGKGCEPRRTSLWEVNVRI
jgi:hypothetical protein